jgi:hypothetical protein
MCSYATRVVRLTFLAPDIVAAILAGRQPPELTANKLMADTRLRAMQRFRSMKTLQKFSSVHAQIHNHFNQDRHLINRNVFKQRRADAMVEWRALAA